MGHRPWAAGTAALESRRLSRCGYAGTCSAPGGRWRRGTFGLLRRRPGSDSREGVWAGVSAPTYGLVGGPLGTGWEFQRLGPNGYDA